MTPLYHRIMEHIADNAEFLALAHQVWDPTPWVIDVFIGKYPEDLIRHKMSLFCRENFGKESWPIHDRPADWCWGSAIVNGWTWIGFKTNEMMEKFLEKFPQGPAPE